jgi:hypothetical protein
MTLMVCRWSQIDTARKAREAAAAAERERLAKQQADLEKAEALKAQVRVVVYIGVHVANNGHAPSRGQHTCIHRTAGAGEEARGGGEAGRARRRRGGRRSRHAPQPVVDSRRTLLDLQPFRFIVVVIVVVVVVAVVCAPQERRAAAAAARRVSCNRFVPCVSCSVLPEGKPVIIIIVLSTKAAAEKEAEAEAQVSDVMFVVVEKIIIVIVAVISVKQQQQRRERFLVLFW